MSDIEDRELLLAAAKRVCESDRIEVLDSAMAVWKMGDQFYADHSCGDEFAIAHRRLNRAQRALQRSEAQYWTLLHAWCDGDEDDSQSSGGFIALRGDEIPEFLRRLMGGDDATDL